jgi:hypothetical protein
MQKSESKKKEAGFTFAELTFAMLILVVAATVLINHLSVNYSTTATERDRVFAFSKAQAILSEIQSLVDRGGVEAAVDLDVLDDGLATRPQLTIQTDGDNLVVADHPVSGNYQRDGQWLWSRQIAVQPFLGLNNRNVRYVTVRIFKRDKDGNENAMADLSAVINSAANAYPTTQVFDVYLLAVENIPGWWVFMDSIKPFVESMITDLENRNPGMSFRTHWITKAAFGRNQAYRPYINEVTDSRSPIGEVYHYPGAMPEGSASAFYYVPDNITARMNLDGEDTNGYDSDLNPYPYALADFYNHAMRYPDEYALWQARVNAVEVREGEIEDAVANGMEPPAELNDMSKEPTLRILLDEMSTDPERYKNALLINLHGELLPMPALRNYSDAAKDPVNHPNWRAVTHPEELRTKKDDGGDTDPLRFRMYSYVDYPMYYSGADRMTEPMIVEFMGVNLLDSADPTKLHSSVSLENVPGGVSVGGTLDYASSWQSAKHVSDGPIFGEEMYYTAEFISTVGEQRTRLYLYNTPLGCAQDGNSRGLANTERARLYQMEYVPCPLDLDGDEPEFEPDLTDTGSDTKNTARWTLEIDPSVLTSSMFVQADGTAYDPTGDVQMQVRTRIASNFSGGDIDWETSGSTFPALNQPDNLSTTYAWWSDSREDVPMTERAQFNGDPRHVPYMDCFRGGDDFADSYNWYHDELDNGGEAAASDFQCIRNGRLRNRWNSSMWCDVPRYFELLRNGVVESGSVYTSLTGFSYYYMGIGNDIGYDSANGYPNSIPSDLTPYGGSGAGYINTITGQRKCVLVANTAFAVNWWAGFPWLGELYPDSLAASFFDTSSGAPRGNLSAGNGVNEAFQYRTHTAYGVSGRIAYGTELYDNHQRTSTNGCSAFFNIGTSSSRFRHLFSSGDATLTSVGEEVAANYSMTMPETAPVSRPFSLDYYGAGGDHWNWPPYSTRYTGSLYETYYSHASGTGSGLVKLTNPSGTSAGYIVVNGISAAVSSGTTFIAKWAVLSLAHSFFEVGDISNTLRIPQLARVEIESPTEITELNNPEEITVLFTTEWTRWDGLPYTETGTFSEDESLLNYQILYSRDNGTSWLHVQDNSPAKIGELSTDPLHIEADTGLGDETYTWDTPVDDFPESSYLLRIECYRENAQVHYSWHQNKIYIQR